jgi:hypothetical protein
MSRCDLFHLPSLFRCARYQIEATFASTNHALAARMLVTFIITHVADEAASPGHLEMKK